jgi:NIMA (never in mitosis gene a)-related kinase 1/4/5
MLQESFITVDCDNELLKHKAPIIKDKQVRKQTYTQVKLLGEGSYGRAYLVKCSSDSSYAVIKTMSLNSMSDQAKKEAYKEAKILEKLDHSNIVKFIEVFRSNKPFPTLNIVMEYADGGDLNKLIKNQQKEKAFFPEETVLDWFCQICLAVKHLHDKRILHRDLKSGNIFLTKSGMVKLGDFGISKSLENTLDKAKTVIGTPYYLSPEIIMNKPYSFQSDIWSLGVLLYEMSFLKMPFDAKSMPMLTLKIIKGEYTPLPKEFSSDIKNLIASILVVDAKKRPTINDLLSKHVLK